MNGLAASRRRRGLPGSVLNIGVIYGLGYLHREKDDLYTGLEREGYPPISERDIHHMFLEAIVAGRPGPNQVADITTGLSRYHVNDPNPLHWHRDPRFSHYTVPDEDGDHVSDGTEKKKKSVRDMVEAANSAREAAEVLAKALAECLESLLRLPADSVGGDSSVAELGVDSLAAVEIRSWIWKAVGRDVAVMKILGARSIAGRELTTLPNSIFHFPPFTNDNDSLHGNRRRHDGYERRRPEQPAKLQPHQLVIVERRPADQRPWPWTEAPPLS